MAERVSGIKASVGFSSATGPRSATRISPVPYSAGNCRTRAATLWPHCRWHRQRQGRPRGRRNCSAWIPGWHVRDARDHGSAAFGDRTQRVERLDLFAGQRDPSLAGMGCTFTALVLRGRIAHIVHVGDTRAYRLAGPPDLSHHRPSARGHGAGRSNMLYRALGVEPEARLDYIAQPMARHDRFLLCSDGVHGYLPPKHRRHSARAFGVRRYRPRAGRGRAGCRQHRQLHGPGAGRGGAADRRLGGYRRGHHAVALFPT